MLPVIRYHEAHPNGLSVNALVAKAMDDDPLGGWVDSPEKLHMQDVSKVDISVPIEEEKFEWSFEKTEPKSPVEAITKRARKWLSRI